MLNNKKLNVEIIVADYYKKITTPMLKSSTDILKKNKINYSVSYVAGAYEIPQLISYKIKKNQINLFIAFGCIIKGETYHFEVLSNSIAKSLLDLCIHNKKTFVTNGILNVNKMSQAVTRSSNKKNKGIESANAMLSIIRCIT
ncbi:6,7-dimethyl-8-ribityllumazine synthase [Alphaproteobacteria bacterium]|jgi:6,7-dimethyl-8-ribityllumazine synthase|nr:6,7-dimethyl-8-ribityllumazine synthase [Alphaproteobacteria bacterium]MDB4234045.1 6,7-dimethyl-8-ribityllumazine synthase [Alphaproteobacteria bacterium]MDB9825360.1 6,7-dimethyl-8-ribityllumazine synthase [Alphaproteobacteria bacterium]